MRKVMIGILIVCLYGFPYVFYSMYQDFATTSMSGYLLMIGVTSVLAFSCKFFSYSVFIFLGNIVSLLVS
ncbi:hypothetical protein [Alkalicoccobacillus murimartini]|uniref:Uncharacterized protein n=1 Tax=Alkalicoccobacillus murimartini TaxID=171685 RepID=A0ABT9YGH3_9BACI|nr:hypothetical protein [Alkalicoccobacillus murimartini]MDQ0206942.1 hypothetical protein [Alkalicoccobacillus murimartini]